MRKSAPKLVNHVMNEANSLQMLQLRANTLAKLTRAMDSLWPIHFQKQARIANYRDHRLIIEVTNASWLNRLRYEKEFILSSLRKSVLPELSGIDFIINPDLDKLEKKTALEGLITSTHYKLTIESAQLIENLAKNCTAGLKDSLIKLAQHAKKTNNN